MMKTIYSKWHKLSSAADNRLLPERAAYGYIPGLDGLRAVAVLIVILAHFGISSLIPGGFGVTVFFFLSGFLITRLLIAESESNGRVNLKQFYIRRLIRLYPALLFMVGGTTLIFYALGYGGPSGTEFAAALGYFTNFYQVAASAAGGDMPFMSWTHLWSLAVEEHFYMLFPLLVILCGFAKNRLLMSVIAIICLVPLWRLVVFTSLDVPVSQYNYMMTDARIDSIAWGCLLTILLHKAGAIEKLKSCLGIVPLILAGSAILLSLLIRDEMFRDVWRYSVQGAAMLVLFLNFFYLKSLRFSVKLMEISPLAWIGRVSYALYLWHYPVLDLSQRMLGESAWVLPTAAIGSLVITAFSFYAVEKPFLILRKRFGSFIPVRPAQGPRPEPMGLAAVKEAE